MALEHLVKNGCARLSWICRFLTAIISSLRTAHVAGAAYALTPHMAFVVLSEGLLELLGEA